MRLEADIAISAGGREFILKPLTVRQRLSYANLYLERVRTRSIETARTLGLKPVEAAEFLTNALADAERMSTVVMSCWTLEGALAIVALSSDQKTAEELGNLLEPSELGLAAARCMGVDPEAIRPAQPGN